MATLPAFLDSSPPPASIALVRRDDLPTLCSVVVDGVAHALGMHKDFRRHPALAAILPEEARLSVAWVHLAAGERLAVHQHPVATMIVISEGTGQLVGDRTEDLAAGDVLAIPAGCRHGFVGGDGGYWALSIQFDEKGLYEDPSAARVSFEGDRSPGLVELLRRNDAFARDHQNNPMFELVTGGHLADARVRSRFLDTVQVLSNAFHRLILLRGATTEEPRFSVLFDRHLSEEYDHAARLAADRGDDLVQVWDPVLDATTSWFVAKMLTLDDAEKAVLVHLVLEVGSRVFTAVANPVVSSYGETDYFAIHEEADADHERMVNAPLDGLEPLVYERLYVVQRQGWDMLNTLCARMSALARA
jgi:quercetin dioxygenase-like cupin family protein